MGSFAGAEFVDNSRYIFHLSPKIADIGWLNHNQRTALAKTVATGPPDSHLVSEAALFNFLFKGVGQRFGSIGAAARSGTDRQPGLLGIALCNDFFPQFCKICRGF